ncbi:hypothetical protein [Methylobacillus sp.]|uniref:hypothetical protein n=1 Tax=Methylobacillus sp. TaxID=56818 RepID=UPI0012CA6205|nr:hypothetical protein [Methylobacillus sp.]MPS49074.1 hypothetical protein [Methylobacillus sp.]
MKHGPICLAAFLMASVMVVGVQADPVPIDNTKPPCDRNPATGKPNCEVDSESIKAPPTMPRERDSVIVPPEVPAEGLPNDPGARKPGSGDRNMRKQQ